MSEKTTDGRYVRDTAVTAESVLRTFEQLQQIVNLVARVVAKFPASTLPIELQPFLGAPMICAARPSSRDDNHLVLAVARGMLGTRWQIRIPIEWLNMHQSQITSAVREMYWGQRDYRARKELARLGDAVEHRKKVIALESRKLENERRAYTELAARITARTRG